MITRSRTLIGPSSAAPGLHALAFTNSQNALNGPDHASMNALTAITVEAWVYLLALNPSTETAVAGRMGTNGGFIFYVNSSGSAAMSLRNTVPTTIFPSSAQVIPLRTWQHIAFTWDGANALVYSNGVVNNPVALTGNMGSPGVGLTVGNDGNANGFIGDIREFRVSNVARYSASFTPRSAPFASDANTLALYRLSEGRGVQAVDSGPNKLHATCTGTTFPAWTAGF